MEEADAYDSDHTAGAAGRDVLNRQNLIFTPYF